MSKNHKCTCKIPHCKLNGVILYTDIESIRKHLHQKHGHHELVKFAYEIGLIPQQGGYVSHFWLVNEIAQLCLRLED